MFERLKEFVNNAIGKDDKKVLLNWPLSDVQGIFEMKYMNDWLLFNAMNEEQAKNALSFKQHANDLIKNLYVPDYQSKNV